MKNIRYLKGFIKSKIGDWLTMVGSIVLFMWTLSVATSFSNFWVAGLAWLCIVGSTIYQRWTDYMEYLEIGTKIRLDKIQALQEREKLEKNGRSTKYKTFC